MSSDFLLDVTSLKPKEGCEYPSLLVILSFKKSAWQAFKTKQNKTAEQPNELGDVSTGRTYSNESLPNVLPFFLGEVSMLPLHVRGP